MSTLAAVSLHRYATVAKATPAHRILEFQRAFAPSDRGRSPVRRLHMPCGPDRFTPATPLANPATHDRAPGTGPPPASRASRSLRTTRAAPAFRAPTPSTECYNCHYPRRGTPLSSARELRLGSLPCPRAPSSRLSSTETWTTRRCFAGSERSLDGCWTWAAARARGLRACVRRAQRELVALDPSAAAIARRGRALRRGGVGHDRGHRRWRPSAARRST